MQRSDTSLLPCGRLSENIPRVAECRVGAARRRETFCNRNWVGRLAGTLRGCGGLGEEKWR